MKLKNELEGLKNNIKKLGIDNVTNHAKELKKVGGYKDFNTRLAWDVMNATIITNELYGKYNCNDSHITTLGIKALKDLNIIN